MATTSKPAHAAAEAQAREPQPHPSTDAQKAAEPPAETIADEQRRRSDEIERQGVAKWVDAHDERPESERQNRQIPGVAPTQIDKDPASWEGSTRSTQEARAAQNRAAP